MALIHLADASLTRSGASAPALAGLAFSVPAGETLAVWGGNGSGKTTLAHWLAGWVPELLAASTEGTATFDGMPLTGRRPADWATDIQYVGSTPASHLTGCAFSVAQEVAFGPENLGQSPDAIRQVVNTSLALCDAGHLAHRHPASLSGGETQRVVLAAALAMQPRLLVLDQAFSRLTPAAARSCLDTLHRQVREQGLAVVLLESHFDLAARYADRAVVLQAGRQVASGTPREVMDTALQHVTACDALRAAQAARVAGHWRPDIPAPVTPLEALQAFAAQK